MCPPFALLTAFLFLLAAPQSARAHGELLIRIGALTRQIEAAEPSDATRLARLHLERGERYREHQDWSAATSDYARAADLDANLTAVDLGRARLLADSGQLHDALAMFDQFLERRPAGGEGYIGRARALLRLGRRAPAVADFRRGLQHLQNPGPEIFLELAGILEADDAEEALRALDEGIKKLGPVAALQSRAFDLELRGGNHDAALARLDGIIERAGRRESWLARRGEVLLEAGRFGEARESFEAALAAIKLLPGRLQEAPPMLSLKARINTSLAGLDPAAIRGKGEVSR